MQHICKIRKLDERELAMLGGFVYTFELVKFRFKDGKVYRLKDIRKMYNSEYIPIRDLYYYTGIISGLAELITNAINKTDDESVNDTAKKACKIFGKIADEWTEILENSGLEEFNGVQHVDIILPNTD